MGASRSTSASGPARLLLCVKLVCNARGTVPLGGKSKGNVLEGWRGAPVLESDAQVWL